METGMLNGQLLFTCVEFEVENFYWGVECKRRATLREKSGVGCDQNFPVSHN